MLIKRLMLLNCGVGEVCSATVGHDLYLQGAHNVFLKNNPGPVVKNLPFSAGDAGSILGLGPRSHMPQSN